MDDETFERALQAIAADRRQGASELARCALDLLAESAERVPAVDTEALRRVLARRAKALAWVRPSMTPLRRLAVLWREGLDDLPADLSQAREQLVASASDLAQRSFVATEEAARRAAELIGANKAILTHSHSSTVRLVFEHLAGKDVRAIVTESRPLYEGHALAAALSKLAVPTTLITDAQIALAAQSVDLALVGADTVCADGSVVNKAGTRLLALACREAGLPFYVCCESHKLATLGDPPPELEAMDPAELGAPAWPYVRVQNVYFDITPPELVTAWVTEEGVMAIEEFITRG